MENISVLNEIFPLVYFTNMDYRPDRRAQIEHLLVHGLHVSPVRMPGVVYTGTSNKRWNGFIGCGLCHLEILKVAQAQNQNILIFEDDALLINDYTNIIQNAINELPENWDMLYLGGNICSHITRVSSHLGRLTHAQSTHAYGVNKNFLDELIDYLEPRKYTQVIDITYASEIIPTHNCFITIPMIAIQRADKSDIEGQFVNYPSWMEARFFEQLNGE
jgi:GR25 family glycosyltransferase involved in LPS biosynthesis